MFFRIKKKSIFYKYLISYFLIFIIPLIIMTVVLYKNSVVNLQNEIESSNMTKLSQVRDLLDARLKEMERLAVNISNDVTLMPYMMRNYGMKAREGIEQLGRYQSNSAFIDQLMLYFREDTTVYSPKGQSSLNTLVKNVYLFDEAKGEKLIRDINSIKTSTLCPAEKVSINANEEAEIITYLVPIPKNTSIPTATVLFFIKKDNFDRMIKDTLGTFKGTAYIFDKNGSILVSVNNGDVALTEDMAAIAGKYRQTGVQKFELDKKIYSVVSLASEDSGIRFVTLMPTDQFLKKVVEMKTLILEIVLILILFGVGMAITLSINNYRPIRSLSEYLRLQWSVDGKSPGKNEIEDIRNSMDYAIHQNKNMATQISSHMPLVREQVLMNLLKGNIRERSELEKLFTSSQICLEGPYYSVMVLSWKEKIETPDLSKEKNDFLMNIYQELEYIKKGYAVELVHNGIVAFIINMSDEKTAREEQYEFAHKIQEIVAEYFGNSAAIGVGKIYKDIGYVNRSFIEALAAVEYKLIKGYGNILFFDEVMQIQKQEYWYPVEEQIRFLQSIKQGDAVVALENLKSMMSKITEKGMSLLMLRFVCFDIINMVVKTVNEMNMTEFSGEMETLMEFASVDELEGRLENLLIKICRRIENNKENKNIELGKQILEYIEEHYLEGSVSLESLSEKFGFSIYYLSRFFKGQTGDNFIDYLTGLRLEAAKKLLAYTDKPVKDIVGEIGYVDVPSFVRKFKKLEGITPGKYRELYSGKEKDDWGN